MELAGSRGYYSVFAELAFDMQAEDGVRSGAGFVVEGGADVSGLGSLVEYFHGFLASADVLLSEPLHVYALPGVLPKLQVGVDFVEQIDDLLVINLQERTSNCKVDSVLLLLTDTVKQEL